ncbi:succinate dehydrogenase assembly factor 2 [soil metagenome]
MDDNPRLRRMQFRAWHRGTKEADLMIGGFFDHHGAGWNEAERVWFEALLDEEDVEVMAWALGTMPVPERYQGAMMDSFRKLDFIRIAR